jgi:hypothetical protein
VGSNPTPSASPLFADVRSCPEDAIESVPYLTECIYWFVGVRQIGIEYAVCFTPITSAWQTFDCDDTGLDRLIATST